MMPSAIKQTANAIPVMSSAIKQRTNTIPVMSSATKQTAETIQMMPSTIKQMNNNITMKSSAIKQTTNTIPMMSSAIKQTTNTIPVMSSAIKQTAEIIPTISSAIKQTTDNIKIISPSIAQTSNNITMKSSAIKQTTYTIPTMSSSIKHTTHTIPMIASAFKQKTNSITKMSFQIKQKTNTLTLNSSAIKQKSYTIPIITSVSKQTTKNNTMISSAIKQTPKYMNMMSSTISANIPSTLEKLSIEAPKTKVTSLPEQKFPKLTISNPYISKTIISTKDIKKPDSKKRSFELVPMSERDQTIKTSEKKRKLDHKIEESKVISNKNNNTTTTSMLAEVETLLSIPTEKENGCVQNISHKRDDNKSYMSPVQEQGKINESAKTTIPNDGRNLANNKAEEKTLLSETLLKLSNKLLSSTSSVKSLENNSKEAAVKSIKEKATKTHQNNTRKNRCVPNNNFDYDVSFISSSEEDENEEKSQLEKNSKLQHKNTVCLPEDLNEKESPKNQEICPTERTEMNLTDCLNLLKREIGVTSPQQYLKKDLADKDKEPFKKSNLQIQFKKQNIAELEKTSPSINNTILPKSNLEYDIFITFPADKIDKTIPNTKQNKQNDHLPIIIEPGPTSSSHHTFEYKEKESLPNKKKCSV